MLDVGCIWISQRRRGWSGAANPDAPDDYFAVGWAGAATRTQVEPGPSGRIASVSTWPTAALGRLIRSNDAKVAAMSTGATTP